MQSGKYSQDDLDDALAVVQDFDPIGVGARICASACFGN